MKYYPPVFGYKPSFDGDKGDRHKMEVDYIIRVDENGDIEDAIPQPSPRRNAAGANNGDAANAVAAADPIVNNQLKTQTVEFRKCKTRTVD